jgi:hypothetical protein
MFRDFQRGGRATPQEFGKLEMLTIIGGAFEQEAGEPYRKA